MKGSTPAASMAGAISMRMRERAPALRAASRTSASSDLPKVITARCFGIRAKTIASSADATAKRVAVENSAASSSAISSSVPRPSLCSRSTFRTIATSGLNDLRQLWNFAPRVGAAFEDRCAMLGSQSEDRHRHANQVVQIARG